MGIFIAVDPKLYRDGFARLFPLDRQSRVKDVLDEMGDTLFKWLLGRFMTMAITGTGTAAALFVLGVPLAITVGVITGLLTFVPNIGGITALFRHHSATTATSDFDSTSAANIDTGNHGCNCGFPRFNGSDTLISSLTGVDSTSLDQGCARRTIFVAKLGHCGRIG